MRPTRWCSPIRTISALVTWRLTPWSSLGYQSEPSIWRNAYLQGAEELRHGVDSSQQLIGNKGALLSHVSVESVLDYLAISLDGQKAASDDFELELTVEHPDTGQDAESYLLYLRGGALLYHRIEGSDGTRPHATLLRSQLGALIAGVRCRWALSATPTTYWDACRAIW